MNYGSADQWQMVVVVHSFSDCLNVSTLLFILDKMGVLWYPVMQCIYTFIRFKVEL